MSGHRGDRDAPPAPSALAVWLLERLLGPEDAEAFVGDLLEELAEAGARSPVRARLAFWREALVGAALLRGRGIRPSFARESRVRSFLADLRHGLRLVRRAPGFAVLAVATIGLAVGATTAVFSVLDPLLLRPLPYAAPSRLVTVWERDPDGSPSNVGWETYRDLAASAKTLESAAATGYWQPTLTEGTEAERLDGARVSWRYFRTLGVRPALGRDFTAGEDVPANNHVVILSHGLWARRFGADPSVVGGTISLDGAPYTVAGVMPEGFEDVLTPGARLWRVLGYDASLPWACRTCRHLRMIGRLRPGATAAAARAELDRLSAILVSEYPKDYPAAGMRVVGAQAWVTRQLRPILYAAAGAVALLLLLALANLASLQLARLMRREREFVVRSALGAARGRLVRQVLAEAALLVVPGFAGGAALAWLATGLLRARLPADLPRVGAMHVDGAAVALAAGVAVLLGAAVSVGPRGSWKRASALEALRSGGRLAGPRRRLVRASLVVVEVAVAVALLQGAGLLSRTVVELFSVNPGFDPSHLVTMEVQSTGARYAKDAAIFANHARIRQAVAAVPGVRDVALASQLPLRGDFDRYGIMAQDRPLENPELAPSADRYAVSGDFLRAMRIRILRGRGFSAAELADSVPYVAVVSDALARRIWGRESAIGKRIRLGDPNGPWRTVIGVAADVRHTGLDDALEQQVYLPERQWGGEGQMVLVARTAGDPAALAPLVRRAARDVDPTQPVIRVSTMDRIVAASVAQRTLALALFGAFAAIALLMAAAGIYGALSGAVAERTREMGVRLALGATPGGLLRRVAGDGGRLAGLGLLIGLAGALAVGRVLAGLLYGVGGADPLTLLAVAALLLAVAAVACLIPARRASAVDPAAALRAE